MTRNVLLPVVLLCAVAITLSGSPATSASEPSSDTGPAIAYKTVDRSSQKLCVMDADGSNPTTLVTANGAEIFRPAWSPDGEKIAFGSNMNGNTGVYVVNADGTGLLRIASTDIVPAPAWSPKPVPGAGDGNYRIAFNDRGSEGDSGTYNDIFIVNVDGSDRTQVFDTSEVMEGKMAWSPDGTKLVFNITDDVLDRFGIYDFNTASYSTHRHGGAMQGYRCYFPSWARTQSDMIVWHVQIGTDRDIFVTDLDDLANPVRLTTGGNIERFPCWSPDDSKIVFEDQNAKNGKTSIVVMNSADGSGRTTLLSGGQSPTWKRGSGALAGPSVTITTPADAATVWGNVTISATATGDRTILEVDFYVDGEIVATDTSSPYSISWGSTGVSDGGVTITATATDSALETGSDSIQVTVDNVDDPPVVSITEPEDGATVSGSSVTIAASASDDGYVTKVEFFAGTTLIGTDTTAPYSVSWDSTNVADGYHDISAKATDDAGKTDTDTITATVNNQPPSLTITSISPDTVRVGKSVGVTVTGTGFVSGASLTLANGSGPAVTVSNVSVANSTTITASIAAERVVEKGTWPWDVVVTNPGGATTTLTDGFTVTK